MKRFGMIAAGLCAAFVLTACNSTESQNTTAAGAVGTKTGCCASGEAKAGCCKAGDKAACSTEKAACDKATADKGSMGAVGEKKAECTGTKTECAKQCPYANTAK